MKKKLFLLLCALLTMIGVQANQTLADNGVYYIQNVETGLFLSRGGTSGSHALADNYGLAWRLTGTNGSITLQMYDIYSEGFTAGGLGDNSFVDNGSPLTNWTLEGDANGYTIKTGSTYLTASGNNAGSDVVINGDGTGNKTWILLNDAEHAAVLAAKTSAQESAIATTAGIDLGTSTLSEILGNTSNWRTSTIAVAAPTSSGVWTYTENRDQGGANNYGDYGTELYNKSGKFTKTISGLENGIYKLTVRSMHRSTHNAPCWTVGESFTNHTNSYVLANGYYAQLKDWKSAAEKNGNDYNPNSTGQFKTKVEAGNYATDIYTYVSNGTLDITVSQEGFWWGEWFAFNGVTLTYYSDQVSDEDAAAILATANALLEQEMDATVKTNLTNAKNTFEDAHTIANYNALQTAIDAAQASADAYALFAPERTKALALGMSADVIAALAPDVNALKVAEYNFVTTNYQYGVALGEWTSTGTNTSAATFNNEHWSGTTHDYKNQNDGNGQGWNASSWSINFSQNVTLPAGRYVFKVAGRQASGDQVTTSLVVKKGEDVLGTVNDFPRSNNSRGINKSGATAFEGEASAFANNGNGYGWEWRYVKFELDDPATVNIAVNSVATAIHQWVSFGDYTLQTDDEDNVELMEALVNLNSAITTATLTKNTNVGTGVFQYDETTNETLWGVYSTAKSNAEAYEFTSSSTAEEVNALATALTTATTNYLNQPLNAPDAEKHYNIVVATTGHAKLGNAVVLDRMAEYPHYNGSYIDNNTGFTLQASAAPNANLAQACVFTPVAGKVNTYYISTERTEGTVYWTYGSLNDSKVNWKEYQIQATEDAEKKGEFKIAATTTANVFNIVNTTSVGGTIACQAGGSLYTEAGNADFTIAEASKATPNLTIVANVNWATFMSPFAVSLDELDEVSAYKITGVEGDAFTTEEVTTTIPANTPVLLYRKTTESNYSPDLTGWGTAAAETYDEGLLTGFYTKTAVTANANHYLLQKNNDVVAFYHVATEGLYIGAYRAYLTMPGVSEARPAFFFPEDGDFTGINAVEAVEANDGALKDGKYLIGNKIVLVKNGVKFGANGQKLN
jgi:hypothetical protein